ncbi:hypothetical protein BKA66DRAFT_572706 [Pyrenochaeta sp. MPI-SDFR-AT-0127]|nr:hypothetical protein BKA66DRAFT_572706 [Pyrenochaeta sp. MPI-SDFR-AT-0127]
MSAPPEDLYADRGPRLAVYNAAMIAIPTIGVAVRFWSRALTTHEKHRKFWWDDWAVLFALPWCVASNSLAIEMIRLGLGKHIAVVPTPNVFQALKVLFATYLVYDTGLTLAKVSALFFLARIFGLHSKNFNRLLWATHGLVWAWWVGIVFATIFMCKPIAKQWNPVLEGTCGSNNALWLGSAIPSVLIDLIILILPMPMLWRLQLRRSRKILVTTVFVCGYCVILVSIGRLVTVIKSGEALNTDLTWAGVPPLYWLGAETPITILSVSLPSVFFLFRRARQHGAASLFSSRVSGSRIPLQDGVSDRMGPSSSGSSNSLQNIYAGPDKCETDATVDVATIPDPSRTHGDTSGKAIHVSSEFAVSRV